MKTSYTRPDLADPALLEVRATSACSIELIRWQRRYLAKHPLATSTNINHSEKSGTFSVTVRRRDG